MDYFLLLIFLIGLSGIRIRKEGYEKTYLGKEQTTAINGIFVMFVFMRHFKSYIQWGVQELRFLPVDAYLGQMIVTSFLFYSGYGIMYQLMNREHYNRKLPGRILKVWGQFALAVSLFCILNHFMGKHYPLKRILRSFVAYESVGNSNWYIFCILLLYLFTFLGTCLFRGKWKHLLTILWVTACSSVYILLMMRLNKGSWFYDTILCFAAGMFVCCFKKQIDRVLFKNLLSGLLTILMVFLLYRVFYYLAGNCDREKLGILLMECRNVLFILLIVTVTSRVRIQNRVLGWLGQYTFEIYILQRLPMIVWKGMLHQRRYFVLCAVVTVIGAVVFRKVFTWIELLVGKIKKFVLAKAG